jgi:hypothetical protein
VKRVWILSFGGLSDVTSSIVDRTIFMCYAGLW